VVTTDDEKQFVLAEVRAGRSERGSVPVRPFGRDHHLDALPRWRHGVCDVLRVVTRHDDHTVEPFSEEPSHRALDE
jgi:hypothetical protein